MRHPWFVVECLPLPDGIEAAAVTACIQPRGWLRDDEAIAAADRPEMA